MGLPKKHRLRDRRDFRAVYSKGIRLNSLNLVLRGLFTPESEIKPTRIGISISQKVSKKAVVRNRLKRQIRAALRELLPSILPGWKIVIVVRSRARECEYEHFLRELKQLLKKAKIIDGH